jgi:hypothetical protein
VSRTAVENSSYTDFVKRAVRAHGRRVAAGDIDGLAELLEVRDEVDAAIAAAVAGLRAEPHSQSWSAIARVLGVTRQAAMKRWPDAGGARRAGGQPSHLR